MTQSNVDTAIMKAIRQLNNEKGQVKMSEDKKVVVGTVVRQGTAVTVPPDMTLGDAVVVLQQRQAMEEQIVSRSVEFPMHPFEVAHAFGQAIEDVCGTLMGKTKETLFGPRPPHKISIEVEPGKFTSIIWGAIIFPFSPEEGSLCAGWARSDGDSSVIGQCSGEFRQKYEHIWNRIIAKTREILDAGSLFRGKTLRVNFNGQVPDVKAWNVSNVDVSHLVFSQDLEAHIQDHIRTPIQHRELCAEAGVPFKRGILLTGPYGTGKTLLAASVAKEASEHGITVLYIEDAKQLPQAIRMAARLAPAIVFAEDIDRITDGPRTNEVDVLLNTLDGIDTKNFPVMTILTSNYPDKIYKGMIRPGRIDVALHILPPDSEAAQRLVQTYLGAMFDAKNGDLEEMGNALAGMIPAVIREICERSKLSAISRTGHLPTSGGINADDVLRATMGMKNQIELLNAEPPKPDTLDKIKDTAQLVLKALEVLEDPDVREFITESA